MLAYNSNMIQLQIITINYNLDSQTQHRIRKQMLIINLSILKLKQCSITHTVFYGEQRRGQA